MRCAVCKKSSDEVRLSDGIFQTSIVKVCDSCSETEKIPIIKRPTDDQIERSQESKSVRERMERLSGYNKKRSEVSNEQLAVQGTLARLKTMKQKDTHEDVHDNYYWTLNMARRRKKIPISRVSEATGVPADIITAIEKGAIPENFHDIFLKLEDYFGISLLKNPRVRINFIRKHEPVDEEDILEQVRTKMKENSEASELIEVEVDADEPPRKFFGRNKKKPQPEEGDDELDFSNKKQLEDVTLNDLVEMKRKREKKQKHQKKRQTEDSFMGDDIEVDE